MDNKTELRLKAKNIRKGLDIENISHKLCIKIKNLAEYQNADNILLFYPLANEINLLELIDDKKTFYLPRINGLNIEICPYKIGDKLELSSFKTKEPISKSISINKIDLIILPALAADKQNNRLGYGKGYYDRLLANSNAITILPLPKELVFESIPTEPHDKIIDIILTD